jgi:hypothetical protein
MLDESQLHLRITIKNALPLDLDALPTEAADLHYLPNWLFALL